MKIADATREQIIKEHRSKVATKAAVTLQKKYGVSYFANLGRKGGSTLKRKRKPKLSTH